MADFFRRFGHYWQQFGDFMGDAVGRGVLMILYVTVVLPFAIIMMLTSDRLDIREKGKAPAWLPRKERTGTIEEGRQQV